MCDMVDGKWLPYYIGKPWRCEVQGDNNLECHCHLFSWAEKRSDLVPYEEKPHVPKSEVLNKEYMLKTNDVRGKGEIELQELQVCEKHVNEISTFLLKTKSQFDVETTKEVRVLKNCGF